MELQSLLFITFLLLVPFFLSKLKRSISRNKTRNLPPGPWKLPLIGNILHLVGSLPHHALNNLSQKYGPLMHLQLGEISAVIISSPRLAKQIYKTHELIFINRPQLVASEIAFYNNVDIAFAPHGDYWRLMRRICASELLSPKKVKSFSSLRESEVSDFIESIPTGSVVNISERVFSLTNTITCKATFGGEFKDQVALIEIMTRLVFLLGGFDVADLFPSFKLLHGLFGMRPQLEKMHRKLDGMLENIINERKKSTMDNGDAKEEDLLGVLLRLQESRGLESPITSNNVKAVIVEMFTGGTEAASTVVEWAMSELMRNPRVMQKAQAELKRTFKGKKTIYEADIPESSYLNLVIKETLRLHPPAPLLLPRECREEYEVDGYIIPTKTKIIVNAWSMARDPDYWKDPEVFQPERFENSSVDFVGDDYEYIPFGAGRRICPGIVFGLANAYLPLARLLYHFDWKLPDGMNPEDLDMSETLGAAARRTKNLCLTATNHYVS